MRRLRDTASAVVLVAVLGGTIIGLGRSEARGEIVRFAGAKRGTAWSRPVLQVLVVPVAGGATRTLVVPNKNPMGRKFDPDPRILDLVKGLKKGDLLEVESAKFRGKIMVRKFDRFEPKPGEADPMGFVFLEAKTRKLRGAETLVVTLEKFRKTVTVIVPNRKDADGKGRPDPAMTATIDKLGVEDVVEIATAGRGKIRTLTYLAPYMAPIRCRFVKLVTTKTDTATTVALEVTDEEDKSQQIFLPTRRRGRKRIPDAKLLAIAKRLKAGKLIEIKTRRDGERLLVARIAKATKAKAKAGDKKD